MKYDQFVSRVRKRAGLDSDDLAVAAIRATLETLAERLVGGEAEELAAQLPPEIGSFLRTTSLDPFRRLSLEEFLTRVGARERTDTSQAAQHARAVAEVLREAVSPGEMHDVMAQLPPEYDALFAGRDGPGSPSASTGA